MLCLLWHNELLCQKLGICEKPSVSLATIHFTQDYRLKHGEFDIYAFGSAVYWILNWELNFK